MRRSPVFAKLAEQAVVDSDFENRLASIVALVPAKFVLSEANELFWFTRGNQQDTHQMSEEQVAALMTIRRADSRDYDAIADVMFDAVRHGPSAYTEAQRAAWLPSANSGAEWHQRLDEQAVFIAADPARIHGFMSLADDGTIDLAFIRPSAQGTGVFRRLYSEVENLALQNRLPRLWLHASLNAQSAFSAVGFVITQRESVELRGQSLERFMMEKQLPLGE